jgi:hypothetical protein
MKNLKKLLSYLLENIDDEIESLNPLTRLIMNYIDSVDEIETAAEENNTQKVESLITKYVNIYIPFEEIQKAAGIVKNQQEFNDKIDNAIGDATEFVVDYYGGLDFEGINEGVQEEKGYRGPKKYKKVVGSGKNKKTVRYGAKGYSIAPGTSKGDSYCARSYGQMKDHPSAAKDANSPLRLSRKKWKCSGKRSRKD